MNTAAKLSAYGAALALLVAVVVRRDTTAFQHVHPEMAPDGTWSVRLTLPTAGSYRVFAHFAPTGGEGTTLGVDVFAAGTFEPVARPSSPCRPRPPTPRPAARRGRHCRQDSPRAGHDRHQWRGSVIGDAPAPHTLITAPSAVRSTRSRGRRARGRPRSGVGRFLSGSGCHDVL